MAFPTQVAGSPVAGNSAANVANPSSLISFPSGNVGDLLILSIVADGSAAYTTSSGTWTSLGGSGGTTVSYFQTWYKVAQETGGNTGNDAFACTRAGTEGYSWVVYRFDVSSIHSSTAPANGTIANSSAGSTAPNPPSLDPAGWATEDTTWLVIYGWDGNVAHSTYPANYTDNQITDRWANTNGVGIAAATRDLAAGSEDPGAAAIASTEQWSANTYAIRPAAAPTYIPYPYIGGGYYG